jgi:PAS domain S-box-containing protein
MTTYNLPFLIPYFFSFVITIAISVYAWKRRSIYGNTVYAFTMLAEASWISGYILELISPTLKAKIFWNDFQFIGILYAPVFLFIYILQYIDYSPTWLWRLSIFLLVTPGIFLVILFTNLWHGSVRHQSWIEQAEPFNTLAYHVTWPMQIIFICVLVIYLTGVVLLLRYLYLQHQPCHTQGILLFTGFMIPLIGGILDITVFNIAGQLNVSPFFIAIGNIFLAWGLFRYGLFDIKPVAREKILENTSDLVIIVDKNNRIVDINRSACEATGVSATSAIGLSIDQLLDEKVSEFDQLLSAEHHHIEIILQGPAQKPQYFDLHITDLQTKQGIVIGHMWVAHDITERKRAEIELRGVRNGLEARILERTAALSTLNENLRVERDYAQQVMNSMGQGLTVTNANGLFTYVNPAFAAMLGRLPQDIIGKSPVDFTYDADLPVLQQAFVSRQQGQTTQYETNLIHADGSFIQVLITGAPTFLNDKFSGTVATITDLSERKRTERIQTAIYQISEAAQTTKNPEDFFRLIREIVSDLMPTRNLYVALYDPVNDLLNFGSLGLTVIRPHMVVSLRTGDSLPDRGRSVGKDA